MRHLTRIVTGLMTLITVVLLVAAFAGSSLGVAWVLLHGPWWLRGAVGVTIVLVVSWAIGGDDKRAKPWPFTH